MNKEQLVTHWEALPANQPIQPSAVPYKHKGSTYDQDGLRITGSQTFIDGVLSRFKDLLEYENGATRLQVNHQETVDRYSGQKTGTYNCYVQVHRRGRYRKF